MSEMEVLLKNERLSSLIVESAPSGLVMVDQQGAIVLVNAAVEKLFGYSREELVGMPFESLIPERFRAENSQQRDGSFNHPIGLPTGEGRDLLALHKSGLEITVEIALTPLKLDKETFSLASILDLSDRKHLEQELRSAALETKVILDALPSLVFFKDCNNRILRVNQAAADSLGLQRDQIEGRHSREIYPDDADRFHADDLEVIRSGKPKLGYVEPIGDRWVRTDKIPICGEQGEIDQIIVVATDVTEVREAQSQLKLTQHVVNLSADAVFYIDEQGAITYSNQQASNYLGYTQTELTQLKVFEIDPNFLAEDWSGHWSKTKACDTLSFDSIHKRKDGSTYDCEIRTAYVEFEGEELIVATVRNTSELKAIEGASRDSEAKLRGIFDSSSNFIGLMTPEGILLDANRTALEAAGVAFEDIVNTPFWETPWWSHSPELQEQLKESIKQAAAGTQNRFEASHPTGDGDLVHVTFTASPIFSETGEVIYVVPEGYNITKQKLAEQSLRESEQKYRTLYEKSPVMHANVDPKDACIKDCNQLLVRRLGFASKEEILGLPIRSLYHEDCHDEVQQAFQTFVETGSVRNAELVLNGSHGEKIPVVLNVASVKDSEGNILYSSSTWVDVTELKKHMAELERANRDLEEFAYIASHDLKAPLRAISHLSKWLEEDLGDQLNAASTKHLMQLQQRVGRMDALLNDLLAYSRAGRVEAEVTTINLPDLVADVAALGIADGFELITELPETQLLGRKTPLETVIRNLVANAIKHHDCEQGKVWVQSEKLDRHIKISVLDDGPGIDPKLHRKAFTMFQTLQPRDEVEGSGMGLAIVKKLVEAEGGRIWIEANDPRGTCVSFTWPLEANQ